MQLNPDESVVKKTGEIGYGTGLSKKNELILTNQRIILIRKNVFGKTKDVVSFPLSEIVISNQQAQVMPGKKDIVTPTLDVYFRSGMESFIFTWEDEVKEWADCINTMLTGQPARFKTGDWMEEIEEFAESFAGAAEKVRKAFGIKSTEQVSCSCPSCGASLTGMKGETVRCGYCGSYHTLPSA